MATPAGQAGLVLSHLAALPVIFILLRRIAVEKSTSSALPTLVILITALLVSTAYHMCQVGWACFGSNVEALQVSDHFTVYFTITWFLLWASGATERLVISVTFGVVGLLLPQIIANPDSWVAGIVIIALSVFFFILFYTFFSYKYGFKTVNWLPFSLAIILLVGGAVFHVLGGDFGNSQYPAAHTLWHIFALLALYFAALARYWEPRVVKRLRRVARRK